MADEFVYIYRAMRELAGMPIVGSSATTLGVRKAIDIEADQDDNVIRPDFKTGAMNGMSGSPSVLDLPVFAFPVEWGGTNRKTRVWRIHIENLGPDLTAQRDGPGHISVGPARKMTLGEFVAAIESTAPHWELVLPPPDQNDDAKI